jgi:hypothetical protein
MAHGMGLGKSRTKLGKYIDANGLTQGWLERHTGISETTITKLCSDVNFNSSMKMRLIVVRVLQDEIDPHVGVYDFW